MFNIWGPQQPQGEPIQTLRATPQDLLDKQAKGMLSPEQMEARRKRITAKQGKGIDFSPVDHWTQGLARVGDAFNTATEDFMAAREEEKARKIGDQANWNLNAKLPEFGAFAKPMDLQPQQGGGWFDWVSRFRPADDPNGERARQSGGLFGLGGLY